MKKTIGIGIVVTLILGAAIWYFMVYRRQGGPAAAAIQQSGSGLGDADTATFNAMLEEFKKNSDAAALSWLLPYVDQTMTGTNANPLSADYKIGGKLTKAGTFLGEYARAYHPAGTFYGKKPGDEGYDEARQKFNDTMYALWESFKTQYLANQLSNA